MLGPEDLRDVGPRCLTHCEWAKTSELFASNGCARLVKGIFTKSFYALLDSHVAPLQLDQGIALLLDTVVLAQKLAQGTAQLAPKVAHKHDALWFTRNIVRVQINISPFKWKARRREENYTGYEHFHAFIVCNDDLSPTMFTVNRDFQPTAPKGLYGEGLTLEVAVAFREIRDAVLGLWAKKDRNPKDYPAVYIVVPFADGKPLKAVMEIE